MKYIKTIIDFDNWDEIKNDDLSLDINQCYYWSINDEFIVTDIEYYNIFNIDENTLKIIEFVINLIKSEKDIFNNGIKKFVDYCPTSFPVSGYGSYKGWFDDKKYIYLGDLKEWLNKLKKLN